MVWDQRERSPGNKSVLPSKYHGTGDSLVLWHLSLSRGASWLQSSEITQDNSPATLLPTAPKIGGGAAVNFDQENPHINLNACWKEPFRRTPPGF